MGAKKKGGKKGKGKKGKKEEVKQEETGKFVVLLILLFPRCLNDDVLVSPQYACTLL